MLHVVHEVDGQRGFRAGVESREDAGHAAGLDDPRLLEPRVQRLLAHVLGALRRVNGHVGDGRQRDPLAESLDPRLASPCAAPAGAATNANASVAAPTQVKYRFKLIAASENR